MKRNDLKNFMVIEYSDSSNSRRIYIDNKLFTPLGFLSLDHFNINFDDDFYGLGMMQITKISKVYEMKIVGFREDYFSDSNLTLIWERY